MSVSSSPSSSLRMLERHNRSKSTVSSSDTDSAGYASSSGTTTPDDETQTFLLTDLTLPPVKPKSVARGNIVKLSINTTHRNLSSAMKKVKRVAHALVVLKKKRSDDISPILISSPLRERFGKRMAIKLHPNESFYSLPNRRFSFSDLNPPLQNGKQQHHAETITRKFGTISGSTSSFAKEMFRKQRNGPRIPSFSASRPSVEPAPPSLSTPAVMQAQAEPEVWTFDAIFVCVIRVLLFVPWCVAVGGTLLLFPSYSELVTFSPGYVPSPKGLRRFAHWAECGQQHIMIFFACIVAVLWHNAALGVALTSIVASRLVYVWHGFKVDERIPLGEDDQQSLYLVMMGLAAEDGSFRARMPRRQETCTPVMVEARKDDSLAIVT